MKRVAILATTGAVLISAGLLIPKVAYADADLERGNLVERLSEKLGLTESEVEEVMIEVRAENREEREAERAEVVSSALSDGDVTERQVEILDAMKENRPEPGEGRRNQGEEVGDHTYMLDALNEDGLGVSIEELEELHAVMEELGISNGPRGGHRGMRGGNN